MSAIELQSVTFRYGTTTVLDDVSLQVTKGEVLAVLGPSGSGKSTLLRVVMGLALPQRGAVKLAGRTASDGQTRHTPPEERQLAVVFQDLALWPHLSVVGNLAFGLRAKGVGRDAQRKRIERALERVGMQDKAERRPGELSGGEQQRAAIARALVLEPDAVLLDEPLSNLDLGLRDDLLDLFATLFTEDDATVIYVTHDPWEAERLADRVAVMEEGRIVFDGDLRDLDAEDESAFARRICRHLRARDRPGG